MNKQKQQQKKKSKKQSSGNDVLAMDRVIADDKEYDFPSLVDNAMNDGVTFHDDHFVIQTGLGSIKFARTFFVKPSGYPRSVRIGWLDSMFNSDDLDVSVHTEPYDRTQAIKKLKDKMEQLEAVYYSAIKNDNHARIEETLQKIDETKGLQAQIRNNTNGLAYVSVQATVYANSLEELNEKCTDLETQMGGESIELINAYGRQKEGFLSTLPLGRNYLENTYRNLDHMALTGIFPHSSSKLNHENGMPIGEYRNEFVYYNNFSSKLNNYNLAIFGESGSGKGVMVKQILGRGFMDGITRNLVIDVEPEYIGITNALGGIVFEISSQTAEDDSKSLINPLDIYPEKEVKNKGQDDEYMEQKINLNEKVKEVIELFKVMKETLTEGASKLNPIELGVLNDILENLYKQRGITPDASSVYQQVEGVNEEGQLVWEKRYIDMPTISDVYTQVMSRLERGEEELKELASVVKLFTRGHAFGMFDGQTRLVTKAKVSLDEAPIITFDISRLSQSGIERPIAQHVIMTWAWNRFVKQDPKTKKRILQDEAWMMLPFPSMLEYFKLLSARGRKWNVSLTLVSQRYEMFNRIPEARDIVAQFNTVLFMKQADEDIECILDTFKFSPEVGDLIRSASTGDVVMKAGKEIVAFRSNPSNGEWKYLNTNQNVEM
jgi:type IV secretory pathway VirB4 component